MFYNVGKMTILKCLKLETSLDNFSENPYSGFHVLVEKMTEVRGESRASNLDKSRMKCFDHFKKLVFKA